MGSRPTTTTSSGNTSGTSTSDFENWVNGLTTTSGASNATGASTATGSNNVTGQNVTNSGGWAPAQGALQDILTRAGTLSQGSYFTPSQSGQTQGAIQGLTNYAQGPTQMGQSGQAIAQGATQGFGTGVSGLTNTANGGQLNGNPYMTAALQGSLDSTANRVNQQFSGAGRYGSAAHTGALTRELGNIDANARMNNYAQERGYQNAAQGTLFGGASTGLNAAGATDASQLQQVAALQQAGASQDAYDQAVRNAPLQAVDWYRQNALPIAQTGQSGVTNTSQVGQTNQTGTTSQSGTTSGTQNVANTSGGTQNGTQTGINTMTQQTQTPSNIGGMIGGAAMTGLGIMTGNPMMIAGGVSGLAGGAMGGGGGGGGGMGSGTGTLWPSMFSTGGSGSVGGPWATSVFPAG